MSMAEYDELYFRLVVALLDAQASPDERRAASAEEAKEWAEQFKPLHGNLVAPTADDLALYPEPEDDEGGAPLHLPRRDDPERYEGMVEEAVCHVTKMTPDEWKNRQPAEREAWLRRTIEALTGQTAPSVPAPVQPTTRTEPAPPSTAPAATRSQHAIAASAVSVPPPQPAVPREPLTSWHDITDAVGMKYRDKDRIKYLNKTLNGPIQTAGQGSRPMVYRDALVEWWNSLDLRQRALANARAGKRLSAEVQHAYGRSGAACPEISGEVKKRRSDRKP